MRGGRLLLLLPEAVELRTLLVVLQGAHREAHAPFADLDDLHLELRTDRERLAEIGPARDADLGDRQESPPDAALRPLELDEEAIRLDALDRPGDHLAERDRDRRGLCARAERHARPHRDRRIDGRREAHAQLGVDVNDPGTERVAHGRLDRPVGAP